MSSLSDWIGWDWIGLEEIHTAGGGSNNDIYYSAEVLDRLIQLDWYTMMM